MEGKTEYHASPPQYGTPTPQQVIVNAPRPMGPQSQSMTCPSCHAQIMTSVEVQSTTKTHLIALVLCLVFFPCVCVPYCVDSCKSTNHYCPNCRAYLGSYN